MTGNKETIPKKADYRVTPQRQLILQELRALDSHPTARELYERVHEKNSQINLTTVYRTLDFLENQKLILRLQTKDRETRYDGKANNHCHLYCTECGLVQDICDIRDITIHSPEMESSGFAINFEKLEFHGLCKSCQ